MGLGSFLADVNHKKSYISAETCVKKLMLSQNINLMSGIAFKALNYMPAKAKIVFIGVLTDSMTVLDKNANQSTIK